MTRDYFKWLIIRVVLAVGVVVILLFLTGEFK